MPCHMHLLILREGFALFDHLECSASVSGGPELILSVDRSPYGYYRFLLNPAYFGILDVRRSLLVVNHRVRGFLLWVLVHFRD